MDRVAVEGQCGSDSGFEDDAGVVVEGEGQGEEMADSASYSALPTCDDANDANGHGSTHNNQYSYIHSTPCSDKDDDDDDDHEEDNKGKGKGKGNTNCTPNNPRKPTDANTNTDSPYFSPPRLQKRRRTRRGINIGENINDQDIHMQDDDEEENQNQAGKRRNCFNDNDDYHMNIRLHDDNDNDDQEDEEEDTIHNIHMVSILNLVVDHVMKPPSPLEPDEFRWLREQQIRRQRHCNITNSNSNTNIGLSSQESDDNNNDDENNYSEDEINVPVIRVFGPIIRGEGIHPQSKSQDCMHSTPDEGHNETETQSTSTSTSSRKPKQKQPLQHQSGCLHIHGAYPYMLARPVDAGPDGSSYFFQACSQVSSGCGNDENDDDENDNDGEDDCARDDNEEDVDADADADAETLKYNTCTSIDWDDPDSVATIVDDIHYKLEMSLRCSINNRDQSSSSAAAATAAATAAIIIDHGGDHHHHQKQQQQQHQVVVEKQERFIRQITVVNGRGFYTYCNGTVAPFLRVEYYNPSHRWRVKIMLERGFDMPIEHHPEQRIRNRRMGLGMEMGTGMESKVRQTRQDGTNGSSNGMDDGLSTDDSDSEVLKFCCYEAHIPYTMQFFKV